MNCDTLLSTELLQWVLQASGGGGAEQGSSPSRGLVSLDSRLSLPAVSLGFGPPNASHWTIAPPLGLG